MTRVCLVFACLTCLAAPALAQSNDPPAPEPLEGPGDEWTAKKCELYTQIVRDAITLQGHDGLSNAFLSTNQRFIDRGCQGARTLCPQSDAEFKLADLLTVMTMNEGMASTFVPFGCDD